MVGRERARELKRAKRDVMVMEKKSKLTK